MKKILLLAALFVQGITLSAQTLNISNQNVTYSFPSNTEVMKFSEGSKLTIVDRTFSLSDFPHIQVVNENVVDNNVIVSYSEEGANVTIAGNIAQYIDVAVNGAHVNITQSDLVSETTCGEITYVLSGKSANGSLTLNGSYKSTIELRGVNLTNPAGAAIDIENGKRIELSAKNNTVNYLKDGTGKQKAALYCKGHLELKGKGELHVTGNVGHAIAAKEYIEMKNLTLVVSGAVKDAINCNQYMLIESGNIFIEGSGDDGIQVSYKDDADREAEDTGSFTMTGGTLNIKVSAGEAAKGIKADGDVVIVGGNITIDSGCNGIWDATKNKTKASACIGADGNVQISGGVIKLTASGSGGKGVSCDGVFRSDGGEVTIATTGGMLVYSNGTLSHNYTSSADRIASDNKSSAKGIKADGGVVINYGVYYITTATNNAEGLESKKTLDINGGTLFIKAYDDGINSTGNLTISGGDITVISIVGDGIDSNSNLYIKGGKVLTLGSGGMEQGLDAADESRCYVYVTGGTLLSFGGRNPVVSQTTGSQALITVSGTLKAETVVTVKEGENELASFTIPVEYTSSTSSAPRSPFFGPGNGPGGGGWKPGGNSGSGKLLISTPGMASGTTYTLTNGSTNSSAKATYTISGF